MKQLSLIIFLEWLMVVMQAQSITTYSVYDNNYSGGISIEDATKVIEQVKYNVPAESTSQIVTAAELSSLLKTLIGKIDRLENNQKLIMAKMNIDPDTMVNDSESIFLPGTFTVNEDGKRVQFTKGNLYWDGDAYQLENNQTDCQKQWNSKHVSHFYWANSVDYQLEKSYYMPYAEEYQFSSQSVNDDMWCGEDNPLTISGIGGLYVLTKEEWDYILSTRPNASSLCKRNVKITDTTGNEISKCLIIAPDDYDTSSELKDSYTIENINDSGFVCLIPAGHRQNDSVIYVGTVFRYCTSTPNSIYADRYFTLYDTGIVVAAGQGAYRFYGSAIRLVRTIEP